MPDWIPPLPSQWLLDAAANAQRYVDTPGVVAAIDAAERLTPLMDSIQARIDAFESTRSALDHVGSFSSVVSLLQREQDTMAALVASPEWPVPTPADLEKTEAVLLANLPDTGDEIEEVAQAAAEIKADPKNRNALDQLTEIIKRPEVAELSRWTRLILVYYWLCHVTGLALTSGPAPGQRDLYLGVLAIVAAVATILWR